MSQRLVGQRAFITAAGQGIGRAIAEAFVREGAQVLATDLNPDTLDSLAAETGCIKLKIRNKRIGATIALV